MSCEGSEEMGWVIGIGVGVREYVVEGDTTG